MILAYGDLMSRVGADKLVAVVVDDDGTLHAYEWTVSDDSLLRDKDTPQEDVERIVAMVLINARMRTDAG